MNRDRAAGRPAHPARSSVDEREIRYMDDQELQVWLDQLARQQALQTQALQALLEARWEGGADTVVGHLKALDPSLEPQPRVPLYP